MVVYAWKKKVLLEQLLERERVTDLETGFVNFF